MQDRVYFALCNGRIKIGISKNVEGRARALATGNPDTITIICVVEGGREVERAFHRKLKEHRIKNEWFKDCEAVRQAIVDFQDRGTGSLGAFYAAPIERATFDPSMSTLEPTQPDRWSIIVDRIEELTAQTGRRVSEIALLKRLGAPKDELRALVDRIHQVSDTNRLATDELQKNIGLIDENRNYQICAALLDGAEASAARVKDDIRALERAFVAESISTGERVWLIRARREGSTQ